MNINASVNNKPKPAPFMTNYPAGYKNKGKKPSQVSRYKNLGRIYNSPNGLTFAKQTRAINSGFNISNFPSGSENKIANIHPYYLNRYRNIDPRYSNLAWLWMIRDDVKISNLRTKNTAKERISSRYAAAVATSAKAGTR